MKSNSSLNPPYFQFTLFADFGPLRYLFFILCLFIYVTIVSANMVIILAVFLEKSLHQPMYIFISCLCLNSLYGSAGFFPGSCRTSSLTLIWSHVHCFIQVYVIYTYASCELTILTIMAYDRFIAICQPLHYHSKMTFQKLSCVDTTPNNIAGQFITVTGIFIPMFFVLYTYLRILLVCRRRSSEFRGKALQTCLPHIVTFLTFSISLFCELSLTRFEADQLNPSITVILSLEYLIIPPLNNPIVYGLGLPQIKGVILRFLKKGPAAEI
ncbi:Olfactory receptor 51L1 [Dissostichus eleginoides]|uniref:Olfactory receptor 51L1 n=1 Tax=Dissostichus eleginoides TaxID=100907 RepID=A0AAD9CJT7_DISEL|nr:Olfactory receptor 51L1 [Dissostichus eleginoides]